MKVSELLEGLTTYDSSKKMNLGTIKDWLKDIGATKEDLEKAVRQVVASPLVRNDLPAAGLKLESSERELANGTLKFRTTVEKYYPEIASIGSGSPKMYRQRAGAVTYQVYANGQIRTSSDEGSSNAKLVSPKPRLVAGNTVASISKTMTAGLEELLTKFKKIMAASDKNKVKFDKHKGEKIEVGKGPVK